MRPLLCLLIVTACGSSGTSTPTPEVLGPPLPDTGSGAPGTPAVSVPPDSRWQLLSPFPAQNAFEIVSAITTQAGFVATGAAPAPGEGFYGRSQGVVWTSADGLTWQASGNSGLLYGEPLYLAALGTDLFILGDYEPCSVDDQSCSQLANSGNALWRSSAGGGWEMLPLPAGIQGAYLNGMVAGHGQLLLYGTADDDAGTPTVWRSSDGTNWSSYVAPAGFDDVTAMAATATGFILFGPTYDPVADSYGMAALASTDGASFSPLQLPDLSAMPDAEIDSVTAKGSSLVAVGYNSDQSGNDQALVLFSPDGTSWSVAHALDGSFAGCDLANAAAIANGYLAFGYLYPSADSDNTIPQAWFSADGLSWRVLDPVPGTYIDVPTFGASSHAAIAFTAIENDISDTDVQVMIYPWYASFDRLLAP